MTAQPAQRFGLLKKGRIQVGADADLTIFDPDRLADQATYSETGLSNQGLEYVIVAGVPVVEAGTLQDVRPGRAIRRGA